MSLTAIKVLAFFIFIFDLIPKCWSQDEYFDESDEETDEQTEDDELWRGFFEEKPQVRRRSLRGARTLEGSIYEGLRSDYLLSVTLPWTMGMFGTIILLLLCMRTDGWLYHLFTDDYMPPAVKKRMDEEARRAEGRKARMERDDNWNEVRRTWNSDLKGVTERVMATMPSDTPQTTKVK